MNELEGTMIRNIKTNLVKVICQNPKNGKRFESKPFPFEEPLSKEDKLALLPNKEEVEFDANLLVTSNLLVVIEGQIYNNISTLSVKELMATNGL